VAWVVLDGQHRVEAARRCGIAHVPAVVVAAASVEEQARAFVRANLDRVSVNPFALYHARLVAGEDKARSIAAVCRACGVVIPKYAQSVEHMKAGETLALGVIAQMVDRLFEIGARAVLGCVADVYREQPGAIRAPLLRAVARMYGEAPAAERKKLTADIGAYLRTVSPAGLTAKALRRQEQHGGTEYESIAAVIKQGVAIVARQVTPAAEDGGIKQPTMAQRMGRR
jgi:hypothetical protein